VVTEEDDYNVKIKQNDETDMAKVEWSTELKSDDLI
jgi:hypothetical protein